VPFSGFYGKNAGGGGNGSFKKTSRGALLHNGGGKRFQRHAHDQAGVVWAKEGSMEERKMHEKLPFSRN